MVRSYLLVDKCRSLQKLVRATVGDEEDEASDEDDEQVRNTSESALFTLQGKVDVFV